MGVDCQRAGGVPINSVRARNSRVGVDCQKRVVQAFQVSLVARNSRVGVDCQRELTLLERAGEIPAIRAWVWIARTTRRTSPSA